MTDAGATQDPTSRPNNPLLEFLPKQASRTEMSARLAYTPSFPGNSPAERSESLGHIEHAIAPTFMAVEAAMAMQKMLYQYLDARNPALAENRSRIFASAQLKQGWAPTTKWAPWSAQGAVIRGLTGCGKSHICTRVLSAFPQVIHHGPREDCGWKDLRQLIYLRVELSFDGTPGGFVELLYRTLDSTLGTSYADDNLKKGISVNRQLGAFIHLLNVHRCGLLVLEEVQRKNLVAGPFAETFIGMMLTILNVGIPTVMVGNPNGFSLVFDTFSQTKRRLSRAGVFDFIPASDYRSNDWKRLFKLIWRLTIFDELDEVWSDPEVLSLFVWKETGGFPDLLARLREATLYQAFQASARRVEKQHLIAALLSPQYYEMTPLAHAMASRDLVGLSKWEDIPIDYLEERWQYEAKLRARQTPRPSGG